MAAILTILLISMSGTSGDGTIVFTTFETIDLAVRIVSISQFLAKLQVLPVYGSFMAAILNFLLISVSGISGDFTIVFRTSIGPLESCRYLNFWQSLSTFGLWQFYGRHLEFIAAIDVGR